MKHRLSLSLHRPVLWVCVLWTSLVLSFLAVWLTAVTDPLLLCLMAALLNSVRLNGSPLIIHRLHNELSRRPQTCLTDSLSRRHRRQRSTPAQSISKHAIHVFPFTLEHRESNQVPLVREATSLPSLRDALAFPPPSPPTAKTLGSWFPTKRDHSSLGGHLLACRQTFGVA